jgi:hypothetical protein
MIIVASVRQKTQSEMVMALSLRRAGNERSGQP